MSDWYNDKKLSVLLGPPHGPTLDQAQTFLAHPGYATDEVFSFSLIRFEGDRGAEEYFERYWLKARPLLSQFGAEWLWAGRVNQAINAGPGEHWDFATLGRYPSRQAIVRLVIHDEWRSFHGSRNSGLAASLVLVAESLGDFEVPTG